MTDLRIDRSAAIAELAKREHDKFAAANSCRKAVAAWLRIASLSCGCVEGAVEGPASRRS
jgi:hypothetical protein